MPTPARRVLLTVDGVLHDSDLPVQAFARHVTEMLPAERVRPVIAGMRGFLEGKAELLPPDVDLSAAEDGEQAVEILARAAGVSSAQIESARLAGRGDLVASSWAVDQPDGLAELLAELSGRARVDVLAEPGDPAAAAVLDALGIEVDAIVEESGTGSDPALVLVIGTRWAGQLESAQHAGCATALVDRFGRGRGTPDLPGRPALPDLLDPVRSWLDQTPTLDQTPSTTGRAGPMTTPSGRGQQVR